MIVDVEEEGQGQAHDHAAGVPDHVIAALGHMTVISIAAAAEDR